MGVWDGDGAAGAGHGAADVAGGGLGWLAGHGIGGVKFKIQISKFKEEGGLVEDGVVLLSALLFECYGFGCHVIGGA